MKPILSVSPERMRAIRSELESLTLDVLPVGAGRARGPGTRDGWIEGLANTRLVNWDLHEDRHELNRLIEFPALAAEIHRLGEARGGMICEARGGMIPYQVMVNRLDPGGVLDFHRDGAPPRNPERFHLPVVTNPLVEYWQESFDAPRRESPALSWRHMSMGSWWGPIEYQTLHAMRNLGGMPRVHVIVDLIPVP